MFTAFGRLPLTLQRPRAETFDSYDLGAERALALVRALLALAALIAISYDPTKPARYEAVTSVVLSGFALYSVALLVLLRVAGRIRPPAVRLIHGVDILVAATLTLLTDGPSSPFYSFFTFVLLTAAYRWGLRGTIATALVSFLLLAAEAVATTYGEPVPLIEGQFELNRFVIRSTWLLLLAIVVGYLAERERQRRIYSGLVARLLSRTQAERSLFSTLVVGADELFRTMGGGRVRLAAYDLNAGRLFEWDAECCSNKGMLPDVKLRELAANERPGYFFETPADAFILLRGSRNQKPSDADLLWLRDGVVTRTAHTVPPGALASMDCRSVAAVTVRIGDEWHFRMFITDPDPASPRVLLGMLDTLGARVAPAVYNAFQAGRRRTQVAAIERAHLARELHDGVIQSLIGTEMQLDAVRRQAVECGDRTAGELAAIQQLLRGEIINIRELMDQLGSVDSRPHQVVEQLANLVDRFQRETGIAAQFASEIDEVDLSQNACRELVRIAQEALANVRRHSGARHAIVHLGGENGHFTLIIDDDGRGLLFEGRREHQELTLDSRGPRVIKERVRSIGGELTIESRPGLGTRLEVTVPRSQVHQHA